MDWAEKIRGTTNIEKDDFYIQLYAIARGVDMRCFSEAKQEHRILDETRRSIIDALLALGNLTGDKEYHEFAKLVCPSLDEGTISEIARHMDRFGDWPESYLLDTVIDYLHLPDEDFCFLLEQYVNPNIHHSRWIAEEERRGQIHNSELVKVINRYLSHDEYQLEIKDSIGDKDFYQCVSSRAGVQGTVKTLFSQQDISRKSCSTMRLTTTSESQKTPTSASYMIGQSHRMAFFGVSLWSGSPLKPVQQTM